MIKGINMPKCFYVLLLISLSVVWFSGCEERGKFQKVDLDVREKLDTVGDEDSLKYENTLRVSVGSMITPREGFDYYKQLLDYIGIKMKRQIKLIDRASYTEINNLLKLGKVDVAFVCGRPYVDTHDAYGVELLVAPQMKGVTKYHSYIIVNKDSTYKTLEDLRGKSFAFTDPKSNSGMLVPAFMLAKMNKTPDTFFSDYTFTYAHDKSIKAVANKLVDGAAVDSLIWEYLKIKDPELISMTRIILKSLPYGIPPVVVPAGTAPEVKEKLRKVFMNIHKDEKGAKILKKMLIDRFVIVGDDQYNSIREMIEFLED